MHQEVQAAMLATMHKSAHPNQQNRAVMQAESNSLHITVL